MLNEHIGVDEVDWVSAAPDDFLFLLGVYTESVRVFLRTAALVFYLFGHIT